MLRLPSRLSLVLLLALASLAAAHAAVPIPQPPAVNGRAYILIDYASGRVLAADHADDREEPASLTKLMTSYLVFQALKDGRLKLNEPVTISEHAWRSEGSRSFLQVGTQIPAEVLLKGMIVQSGNDASIALAERVGGTEAGFAQMMNDFARRLGMTATHFVNSDGLPDPNHYTTARDMATLARALVRDFPQYYPWYSIREYTWNNIKQQNRNGLLMSDPTVDGMKTGHTDSAGFCLVASAVRNNGMRLISVVMGSNSMKAREAASSALLAYGYTYYETVKVRDHGIALAEPRVYLSATPTVPLGLPQDLWVTVGHGDAPGLKVMTTIPSPLRAPIAAGAHVGDLTLTGANGEAIAKVPLVALKAAPTGGLWRRMIDSISLWFK